MKYFPKNRIISDLVTNGNEYRVKSTKKDYIGFYHKLYNGKTFTGKNPNDLPVEELEKSTNNDLNSKDQISHFVDNWDVPGELSPKDNYTYIWLVSGDTTKTKKIPKNYHPQLKEEDYKLGEFQRYFLKKTNENLFVEVSKSDFNSIKSKDESFLFEIFTFFSIPWLISGNRIKVLENNKKSITLAETKYNVGGFSLYLTVYDEFYHYPVLYGLETKGNELTDINNKIYIGFFNIDDGFKSVEGKRLFPISDDIEKQLFNRILPEFQPEIIISYNNLKNK